MSGSDQDSFGLDRSDPMKANNERTQVSLIAAARSFLAAFGGTFPDWLSEEAAKLAAAIDTVELERAVPPTPVKIAIYMEGGCLLDIVSAGVPVSYALIDFDADGDAPGAVMLPQLTPASLSIGEATVRTSNDADVLRAFRLAQNRD